MENELEMDAKAIGERLVKLRGERTQTEIAKELKISVSALSMYERGDRIPRDNIKIRIAALFRTSICEIFYP